jgi:hypothetical protein
MPVHIEMSLDSPKIILDEENAIFLIEGASYPADALHTYEIVLDWVENNVPKIQKQFVCVFKFKLLSSASRKLVYETLLALEKYNNADKISVHWYYEKHDEEILETGEDFADHINLPFRFFQL